MRNQSHDSGVRCHYVNAMKLSVCIGELQAACKKMLA